MSSIGGLGCRDNFIDVYANKLFTCFDRLIILLPDHQGAQHQGPDSDSGLSGLENADSKKASEANSVVDSGRRSQSLEFLSDDLRLVMFAICNNFLGFQYRYLNFLPQKNMSIC
jgi:hypothetical protein